MSVPLMKERERVSLELIGAVRGLIENNCVPEYMVEFLEHKAAAAMRAHGLPVTPIIRKPKDRSHAA